MYIYMEKRKTFLFLMTGFEIYILADLQFYMTTRLVKSIGVCAVGGRES